jgi:hypothetical protein
MPTVSAGHLTLNPPVSPGQVQRFVMQLNLFLVLFFHSLRTGHYINFQVLATSLPLD